MPQGTVVRPKQQALDTVTNQSLDAPFDIWYGTLIIKKNDSDIGKKIFFVSDYSPNDNDGNCHDFERLVIGSKKIAKLIKENPGGCS